MNITKAQAFLCLSEKIKNCRRCPELNTKGVTENAPGYGNINSKIALIGQSLCGRPCIETQVPFTGGSGRLLDRVFQEIGISKCQVFISNVVHCHPPNNRPSTGEEIANCKEFLVRELEIVRPELIIALGKDAARWFLGENIDYGASVGKFFNLNIYIVYPVYHPSYVMKKGRSEINEYIDNLVNILKVYPTTLPAHKI